MDCDRGPDVLGLSSPWVFHGPLPVFGDRPVVVRAGRGGLDLGLLHRFRLCRVLRFRLSLGGRREVGLRFGLRHPLGLRFRLGRCLGFSCGDGLNLSRRFRLWLWLSLSLGPGLVPALRLDRGLGRNLRPGDRVHLRHGRGHGLCASLRLSRWPGHDFGLRRARRRRLGLGYGLRLWRCLNLGLGGLNFGLSRRLAGLGCRLSSGLLRCVGRVTGRLRVEATLHGRDLLLKPPAVFRVRHGLTGLRHGPGRWLGLRRRRSLWLSFGLCCRRGRSLGRRLGLRLGHRFSLRRTAGAGLGAGLGLGCLHRGLGQPGHRDVPFADELPGLAAPLEFGPGLHAAGDLGRVLGVPFPPVLVLLGEPCGPHGQSLCQLPETGGQFPCLVSGRAFRVAGGGMGHQRLRDHVTLGQFGLPALLRHVGRFPGLHPGRFAGLGNQLHFRGLPDALIVFAQPGGVGGAPPRCPQFNRAHLRRRADRLDRVLVRGQFPPGGDLRGPVHPFLPRYRIRRRVPEGVQGPHGPVSGGLLAELGRAFVGEPGQLPRRGGEPAGRPGPGWPPNSC